MTCYKCGLELAPFEAVCPRCSRRGTPTGTSRLPDLSDSKTQHLVQLEQCRHCRMLIFPGDAYCPSCGAEVERPTKVAPVRKPTANHETRRWVAVGVAVSVLLIAVFIYALKHL